jgi:hypothetical protein
MSQFLIALDIQPLLRSGVVIYDAALTTLIPDESPESVQFSQVFLLQSQQHELHGEYQHNSIDYHSDRKRQLLHLPK